MKISIVTLIKELFISNYNHKLFSLWKSIHQSFSYFCRFLDNLWLSKDLFQMSTISLQANLYSSDKTHFLLSEHINSKNNVFGGLEVPDKVLQKPLYSVKCTAWVAMSKHRIIWPFWFEDDDGRSQTVNKECYMAPLNKYWASLGRRRGVVRAPARRSHTSYCQ